MEPKYLFLMRHGDVYRVHPEEEENQPLSFEGREVCRAHAKELAQRAKDAREIEIEIENADKIKKILISEIWSSEYEHAIGTANEIKEALKWQGPDIKRQPFLHPRRNDPDKCLEEIEKFLRDNDGLFVVGHMPLLSYLLEETTKTTSKIIASVERGEILCIKAKPVWGWHEYVLCWSISRTDTETFDKVREKVKYKMDTAKLLGGTITLGLGWILTYFPDVVKYCQLDRLQRILLGGAALLFFISIALFIATMYHYDSLLMPVRFWGASTSKDEEQPPWIVYRPPSSSTWIIYQNMLRIWNRIFMPATYYTGIAFLLLALAVFSQGFDFYIGPFQTWWHYAIVWILAAGFICHGIYATFLVKPFFGSED
jgi:phosphohistidine phosphatase SixA